MSPVNILSLSREEKRKFLDSFDHVFSDIDGVIWNMTNTINGAAEGFKELREAGKKLTLITNNSVRPEQQCLKKLKEHGIIIEPDHIFHPAKSIAEYLKSIKFEGLIYVIASNNFKTVLRNAGFQLKEGPDVFLDDSFEELMRNVVDDEDVKAVVIDYDVNTTYVKLSKAYYYLRNPSCLLIGGATDSYLPARSDLNILGPGPLIKVLVECGRNEMLTFGKPGKNLAQLLLERFQIPSPNRVLMIGDMMEQDVKFATTCEFQSLLVLSGGCTYREMMAQKDPDLMPQYYAQSVGDFVDFMKDLNKAQI